ncbi:hypothetical protein BT67DRAFT_288626 [Trichocladium antarcticum]|uniref:Uncharacterized protein n=1 Tax=Trichocladium antarcticum TaxID=1450529 RepID=A0AAN6ULJ4_9PEZI|nr:hypothetical protein BT67DRAFT_288626 [Trichocladium antarcticum]
MLTPSPEAEPECKHSVELSPSAQNSKALKYTVLGVIGVALTLAAFFLAVTIAAIARSVATANNTASAEFEPASPDFALYKNTRFRECYHGPAPATANCSSVRASLAAHTRGLPAGFGYLETVDPSGAGLDWCQTVACFRGFKIIPSAPRPAATILSDMACWWAVMLTSASALQHTGAQFLAAFRQPPKTTTTTTTTTTSRRRKPCRGARELSVLDWVFLAYDVVGGLVWWWVSFGLFAADPAQATTIALTAWVTAWKWAAVVKFHPYACALPSDGGARRRLPWVLHGLAALQWAAGLYVLSVYHGDLVGRVSSLESYECLASQIAGAPGATPCAAAELCAKTALFRNGRRFVYDDAFSVSGRYNLIAYFFIWTIMAVLPFVFLFFAWCDSAMMRNSAKEARDKMSWTWRVFNKGPHLFLAVSSIIVLAFGSGYAVQLIRTWDSARNREGPFMFHVGCNALHVPLSPWRDYFDLGAYNRAYRIAKMVFNA